MRRYRVNVSVGNLHHGQIVDIDPALWRPHIEAGWLTPVEPNPGSVVLDDDAIRALTTNEVLDWAGHNNTRLLRALGLELDRQPAPRTGLVANLRRRLDNDTEVLGG